LSNILAILIVAAAGAVTWYGLDSGPAPQPTAFEPTSTMPAAVARRVPEGPQSGLPTRVVVPSAGIDASIDEVGIVEQDGATSWQTAWRAAGHHIDSALPGNPGNVVLTGHVAVADSQNLAVFRDLDRVAIGDIVEVHSGQAIYRYRIDTVLRVSPDATDVLGSDHVSRVTLITCTADLKDRLVIVGTLIA
jgi:sortase A